MKKEDDLKKLSAYTDIGKTVSTLGSQVTILKSEPPKPIIDEDLKVLYNYFSTQRAYLWDEIGHREVKPEEFEKLEMYFKAIRELNNKLIENENKNL